MDIHSGIKILAVIVFITILFALLSTTFYVFRNLLKLYREKRHRISGYKFRTKIVAIFVTLTLIPSIMLFIGASGILTAYIDRLFDPQIRQPLEDSLALAKTFYDIERARTINKARKLIRGEVFRGNITVKILDSAPDDASEVVRGAFDGAEGAEVISMVEGDMIRAVIPELAGKKVNRVFLAESVVPADIVDRINNIKAAHETFTTLKKLKLPLKLNYMLILAFFTSLIVFVAMWVSLRISRGITEPIGALAEATEDIAAGDMDVNIKVKRDDEIGLLVASFNRMVKEVRVGKESLQEAYLRSEREKLFLENIVENIDSGVVFLDEDRNILTINTTAGKILNTDQKEISGKYYDILFKHLESPELMTFIKSIVLKDFTSSSRQVKTFISGKSVVLRVFITHLRDEGGETLGILVVFEDITGILKAEQALAWQEVARRMAHEVKNPLTPIKLSAERIQKKWRNKDENLGKVIETATGSIIREAESLQNLVNEFSRLGRMPKMKKELTDIIDLINDTLSIYSNYRTKVIFNSRGDIPPVEVDREQFRRVIVNLIDNAYNAISDDDSIEVSADYNSGTGTVTIKFTDEGSGIKNEDKEKLFLPYFSTRKEGTGLGLSIVHKIVTEHGGLISVSDNMPRGTVFTVEIAAVSRV